MKALFVTAFYARAAAILPFWRFVDENTSAQQLLYGVRVTCHRFSPQGLVTAQQRQFDDTIFFVVTSYRSSAPTSRRGEKR